MHARIYVSVALVAALCWIASCDKPGPTQPYPPDPAEPSTVEPPEDSPEPLSLSLSPVACATALDTRPRTDIAATANGGFPIDVAANCDEIVARSNADWLIVSNVWAPVEHQIWTHRGSFAVTRNDTGDERWGWIEADGLDGWRTWIRQDAASPRS